MAGETIKAMCRVSDTCKQDHSQHHASKMDFKLMCLGLTLKLSIKQGFALKDLENIREINFAQIFRILDGYRLHNWDAT